MNQNILISIITISYNSEKYIEQTILSVLNQSYKNIEYIIIDGGSTDDTTNIIKKYVDKIAYWHSEKDNGISDAFNKGLAKATGDIVGIINSDDWYEENCFNEIVENYDKADILHGMVRYWRDNIQDHVFWGNHKNLTKEMTVNHMSVFVKRCVYTQNGCFSTEYRYAMDYELMLRFHNAGNSFYFIPKVLANMRLNGASDQNWKKAYQESKRIKDKILGVSVAHQTYYFWQIIRTSIRKSLTAFKLGFIVTHFRNYVSITPKHIEKR